MAQYVPFQFPSQKFDYLLAPILTRAYIHNKMMERVN
jgi:hypothetical protein